MTPRSGPPWDSTSRDSLRMATALHHAQAIQSRKDWEIQILSTIETLLDFPNSGSDLPRQSRACQAKFFVESIQPFCASDFDDLIEERRINGKCGYALCSESPKSSNDMAFSLWRPSKQERRFCSVTCAENAGFLKAQLSDVPVWERLLSHQTAVVLPYEDRMLAQSSLSPSADGVDGKSNASHQSTARAASVEELAVLAMERGETTTSLRPLQVMSDQIVEKIPTFKPLEFAGDGLIGSGSVEGHQPKLNLSSKRNVSITKRANHVSDDDDDDDDDDDGTSNDEDDDAGQADGNFHDLAQEVLRQIRPKV